MFMDNKNTFYWPYCTDHHINTKSDVSCAWSEGWADFLPLAVNGDPCYDYTLTSCSGTKDKSYFDLEAHNRFDKQQPYPFDLGDDVEGRVAGGLYDLYDSNNEGFDRISAGFYPIALFALGSTKITTFYDFWSNHWEFNSSQDPFLSGVTLWWNSINYVNVRLVYIPAVMKQP
jgi:hypothetical protein